MVIKDYTNRKIFYDKNNLKLTSSFIEDAKYVADNMRKDDIHECNIFNVSPYDALIKPIIHNNNETYSISIHNKIVCICGTSPISDTKMGSIWGLGTSDIDKYFISWTKSSNDFLDIMQKNYSQVTNVIPISNKKYIKWLKKCGFIFDKKTFFRKKEEMVQFFRCNSLHNVIYNEESEPVTH
tara:strand:+ start:231 stop:776 length:546 start_codon:yes stop_codon:yes gene_type:complete